MDKDLIISQINSIKENLVNSPFKQVKNRIKALKLLKANIIDMESEIAEALKLDLNKSEVEAYMSEIGLVLSEISYMLKHCKKFAKIRKVRTPLSHFPAKSYRIPCAYGCVLIISPWNYPFMLSIEPMVDAISAGNSIVLKPSATTPHVAEVLEKLIAKTFSPSEVCFVKGGRAECDFLLEQDFDYIFFTGSPRVGKIVMEKAAEKFIPVTLELGGKSPCIVDESANLELTAKRLVFGKFLNCGQTCVAPDYLYCHGSIKDRLIEEIKKQIVLQYGEDPINNPDYPKLVNEKQFEASARLITDENLIFGGKTDKGLLKIEPTIVESTFEEEPMQAEIFGPILPVVTFETIDEAIKRVNSLGKPLAFYVFTSRREVEREFLNKCDFGGGCVNDTIMHIASSHLGFGGLKQSGIGAYHGKAGFDTFTHYKSIVKKGKWLDLPMRYQPYTKSKYKLIRMFLK